MHIDLDDTDWQILQALQENARLTFTELGRLVGLTRPAAAERVRRLEEAGIITGYHAAVDPARLGFSIVAFIRIGAIGDVAASVAQAIAELPEVMECYRGTGGECFTLKVIVTSLPHLEQVIDQLTRYGQVTTTIALSCVLARRLISRP